MGGSAQEYSPPQFYGTISSQERYLGPGEGSILLEFLGEWFFGHEKALQKLLPRERVGVWAGQRDDERSATMGQLEGEFAPAHPRPQKFRGASPRNQQLSRRLADRARPVWMGGEPLWTAREAKFTENI